MKCSGREVLRQVRAAVPADWVGKIAGSSAIRIISRMNEGGVIFADGIEQDHLNFDWGRMIQVSVSARRLNLVMSPDAHRRRRR
jgi:hypothetical protein